MLILHVNLLAVDAATEKLSVALSSGNEIFSFTADAGLRHSELVMDIVDMLMNKAALKPRDLSGAVCTGGPGSFTGLRIGFTLVKGLALALGMPFAAIPSLDSMVRPFFYWPGIAVPVIDAKKGAFFCALYSGGKRLCPDMDATPAEITNALIPVPRSPFPILLIGPGAQMLYEKINELPAEKQPIHGIIPGGPLWGDAVSLLEIARETSVIEKGGADIFAGPEYIRKSDAELSLL